MDKILLIEDDLNLGYLLSESLSEHGYKVSWYKNGKDAWEAFNNSQFILCLVDIIIPGMDGIELVKRIKDLRPSTPIIFITARSLKSDIMAGYDAGCDDYIVKPFEVYQLQLKVKALIARVSGKYSSEKKQFELGGAQLDLDSQKLRWEGGETKLNRIESQLLKLFFSADGQTVTRNFILETIWGRNDMYTSKSLDTYLSKIRRQLKPTAIELENIYGLGYLLRVKE